MYRSIVRLALLLATMFVATPSFAIDFSNQCHNDERVSIAAVGDLLFHRRLQVQAYTRTEGFKSLWAPVSHLLKDADITYANLEGPVAPGARSGGVAVKDPGLRYDNRVYSTYPLFNYHPRVVGDIKESGIDIVSTANNHAMDRGALGAERTIQSLQLGGMPFTGSRLEGQPRDFARIVETNGYRIAWLACTYSNNGMPDYKEQILQCYKHQDEVLEHVERLASDPSVDAIFVTPHWGAEYQPYPGGRQKNLAKKILAAGATAVIGAHPHVPQTWEVIEQENGRSGLVIYSTGNFISNQRTIPQRTGMIAWLELCPSNEDKLALAKAEYTPTWVIIDGKGLRVSNNDGSSGKVNSQASLNHITRLLPKNSTKKLPSYLVTSRAKVAKNLPWHYFRP